MTITKQMHFFESLSEPATITTSHGGREARGRRKCKRPLSNRRPLHIVFKSTKARGKISFRRPCNFHLVEATLKSQARRYDVRLVSYVMMSNHLHIKAKCLRREGLQNFLRRVGSIIAQKLTRARPGKPFGRFWDALVFSRILVTRVEELTLARYFEANRIEAQWGYAARQEFLLRTRDRLGQQKRVTWFAFL